MLRKAISFSSKNVPQLRRKRDSSDASGDGFSKKTEKFEKSEQGGSSECNFRFRILATNYIA